MLVSIGKITVSFEVRIWVKYPTFLEYFWILNRNNLLILKFVLKFILNRNNINLFICRENWPCKTTCLYFCASFISLLYGSVIRSGNCHKDLAWFLSDNDNILSPYSLVCHLIFEDVPSGINKILLRHDYQRFWALIVVVEYFFIIVGNIYVHHWENCSRRCRDWKEVLDIYARRTVLEKYMKF